MAGPVAPRLSSGGLGDKGDLPERHRASRTEAFADNVCGQRARTTSPRAGGRGAGGRVWSGSSGDAPGPRSGLWGGEGPRHHPTRSRRRRPDPWDRLRVCRPLGGKRACAPVRVCTRVCSAGPLRVRERQADPRRVARCARNSALVSSRTSSGSPRRRASESTPLPVRSGFFDLFVILRTRTACGSETFQAIPVLKTAITNRMGKPWSLFLRSLQMDAPSFPVPRGAV